MKTPELVRDNSVPSLYWIKVEWVLKTILIAFVIKQTKIVGTKTVFTLMMSNNKWLILLLVFYILSKRLVLRRCYDLRSLLHTRNNFWLRRPLMMHEEGPGLFREIVKSIIRSILIRPRRASALLRNRMHYFCYTPFWQGPMYDINVHWMLKWAFNAPDTSHKIKKREDIFVAN